METFLWIIITYNYLRINCFCKKFSSPTPSSLPAWSLHSHPVPSLLVGPSIPAPSAPHSSVATSSQTFTAAPLLNLSPSPLPPPPPLQIFTFFQRWQLSGDGVTSDDEPVGGRGEEEGGGLPILRQGSLPTSFSWTSSPYRHGLLQSPGMCSF